jgi:hydroxymethylpyrimidine/phosphomethylpyrimidine kinase
MLANASIAEAVAAAIHRLDMRPVVLDTVMVAKGGARLLDDDAVAVILRRLLPHATVVTANLPEAEVLTGLALRSVADMRRAARAIVAQGAASVVVKGGHLDGPAVDVFDDGTTVTELAGSRIATTSTHGTGCTLAAAIAANLALGHEVLDAVGAAKAYVRRAIERAPGLGRGHGPLGWGTDLVDG